MRFSHSEANKPESCQARRLAHRKRVKAKGRGCSRDCDHHERAFCLGRDLLSIMFSMGSRENPFSTHEEFLSWAGRLLDCSPATVREVLVHVGLWHGESNAANEEPLERMVRDVVLYPRFCVDERLWPYTRLAA